MSEGKEEKKSSLVQYMSNPRCFTLKKWFIELLDKDYVPHDDIIERIASSLATDQDMKQFGTLITSVFEKGYRKAVEDYRGQVEKLGIKINVVSEEPKKNQD